MFALETFEEILKLRIGVSQSDNHEMFRLLNTIHPLTLRKYPSGQEHNGWVVPHDWVVKKALIKKDGKVLFDGLCHPLAVAGYSCSFEGSLSREELDQRLFTRQDLPEVFPFHCMFNYRPWIRDWGFCVPYSVCKDWGKGTYEIELVTEHLAGEMLVGECRHPGTLKDTVIFNAHTCHPSQFNDDLSGVAVLLQLFRWLSKRKTRFSYRAVLAPEHIGTVFYLAGLPRAERETFKAGCFAEMLGIKERFALQQSFLGVSVLDQLAEYVLRDKDPELKVGAFRTIVGNDETVWEAPGIEIPFISISRCSQSHYFQEYHTSADNLSITSEQNLTEALEVLKRMVMILENDRTIHRNFEGLIALSNPKYDLYIERPEPTVEKHLSDLQLRLGKLQDPLPRFFNGEHSLFQIARRFDVPFENLRDYILKFEEKGLIELRQHISLPQGG